MSPARGHSGDGISPTCEEPVAGAKNEDQTDPASATRSRRPRRRILVIDDNHDAADTLREVLEFWGYEVSVAYDGRHAVADARRFRPDIVLCDIGLPGMNGFEIARALRNDEDLRSAPLVALTAYSLPEHATAAMEAGFDWHLPKPADLHELRKLLARAA